MAATEYINARVPVTVDIEALRNGGVALEQLEEAFGPSSLGIVLVKGLPEEYLSLRRSVLTASSYLANLPPEILETLEQPDINYLVGWSLGKEKLKSGQYDTLKGSYYINCGSFRRQHGSLAEKYDPNLSDSLSKQPQHHMPEYTAPSVWPPSSVLHDFQKDCEQLCNLIIDVAILVARACDRFGESNIAGYRKGCLEHVVTTSNTTKARLLHYFPKPKNSDTLPNSHKDQIGTIDGEDEDDWCGTHLDHGCLTGLTSAMYIDESQQQLEMLDSSNGDTSFKKPKPLDELPGSPDPKAGLYIRSRSGEVTQAKIPRDCLAFQTGEALELMTKGRFKAVPHFVRGVGKIPSGGAVARNTLAVFTQPNLDEPVDEENIIDFGTFAKQIVEKNS